MNRCKNSALLHVKVRVEVFLGCGFQPQITEAGCPCHVSGPLIDERGEAHPKWPIMTFLHHTLRLLLALVFLVSGCVKLVDMTKFSESVGDFGLVPDWFVLTTAWLVVLSELAIGASLAFNLRGSLLGVLILLVIFLSVLSYGIVLGLDIQCGCFGPGFHVNLQTQLFIDLGLVILVGAVYWSGASWRIKQSAVSPGNGAINA